MKDVGTEEYLGSTCEIQFMHQDQFSVVDLHWGLTPKSFPFLMNPEDIFNRSQNISLAGQTIETFANEDLLLYLCVHAAKHYWSRLEWVVSVAEIVRSDQIIDWVLTMRRAKESRSEKILCLALLLAENLFALQLPPEICGLLSGRKGLRQCALEIRQRLFENTAALPTQIEMFRFNLQFMDRRRDAVTSLLRSVLVPTISDWQAVALPDPLCPLYYAVRSLRLLVKYSGRLRGR